MEQFSPKVLTKKVQSYIKKTFYRIDSLSKAEMKSLQQMVFGILQSKSVFINQIASVLAEKIPLKKTVKRLSEQYLKEDYGDRVLSSHIESVKGCITNESFIVWDGTDIAKSHARNLEGLEYIYDSDKKKTAIGYNVMNINAINNGKDIIPLYSKAYSYEMGALSSNNEIKKATKFVSEILQTKSMWILDRGADNEILKDFFMNNVEQFVIRLKRPTKIFYKEKEIRVDKLANKVNFSEKRTVVKVKKNKQVLKKYELAIIEAEHLIGRQKHPIYIMITRNEKGGLAYFLVKSIKGNKYEVLEQAFRGYGLRWSIEEYHRHVKQEYGLEKIQMRTFVGLQSVLAILTVAMNMIYNELKSLHFSLLLDSGINLLNKNSVHELVNFIYYKISKIVSRLLTGTKVMFKVKYENQLTKICNQLQLEL